MRLVLTSQPIPWARLVCVMKMDRTFKVGFRYVVNRKRRRKTDQPNDDDARELEGPHLD